MPPHLLLQSSDSRAPLLRYAVSLLSQRSYTTARLTEKLELYSKNHELDNSVIPGIITSLANDHFLDDSLHAASLVRRELARGYGPRYIEAKLRSLRISPTDIKNALSSEVTPEKLREALKKNLKKIPTDFLEKRKQFSKLLRRGFSISDINKLNITCDFDDNQF